ncbi:hypothetical protein [Kosmotoga pacifica]|uniref:hypothetical protein n=1 Tax=Kosmotoga pacifica TaxID=1330330 RepID=UPI0014701F4C|nr:hypothetical protein [Kosmotoga pacifica]
MNYVKEPVQRRIKAHRSSVEGIAVDNKSNLFFTCSYDHTIKMWDFEGNLLKSVEFNAENGEPAIVTALGICPKGEFLVAGSNAEIVVYSLPELQLVVRKNFRNVEATASVPAIVAEVSSIAISPDSTKLVVGIDNGTIKVFEFPELKYMNTFHQQTFGLGVFLTFWDSTTFFSAAESVNRWNINNLDSVRPEFLELPYDFKARDITVDRTKELLYVAGSGERENIKIYSLMDLKFQYALPESQSVTTVRVSREGIMVAGTKDRDLGDSVKLWDPEKKELLRTLNCPLPNLNSLEITSEGNLLISTHENGSIILWNF